MLENVLVRDWMTSPAITISSHTLLNKAHQIMKDNGIRRLPVVDNNQLVGIISIGDVREASPSDATTLSIWELNYLWSQLTVEKVMTRQLITIRPDDAVVQAAELMLEHKIAGLPVVDATGNLVGMLTASDVFRVLVRPQSKAVTLKIAPETESNNP
jgi:acetoin utilization protein AcuB